MTNEEIVSELGRLDELIFLIDDNLKFNITVFIGLLSLVLVASGWGLSLLARKWVEASVNKKLDVLKEGIKKDVKLEVKQELEKDFPIIWGSVSLAGPTEREIVISKSDKQSRWNSVVLIDSSNHDRVRVKEITSKGFIVSYNGANPIVFSWVVISKDIRR